MNQKIVHACVTLTQHVRFTFLIRFISGFCLPYASQSARLIIPTPIGYGPV